MDHVQAFEFDVTSMAFRLLSERAVRFRDRGMSFKVHNLIRRNVANRNGYSSMLHIQFFDRTGRTVERIDHPVFQRGQAVASLGQLEHALVTSLDHVPLHNEKPNKPDAFLAGLSA